MKKVVYEIDLSTKLVDFDNEPLMYVKNGSEFPYTVRKVFCDILLMQQSEKIGDHEKIECYDLAKAIHKHTEPTMKLKASEWATIKQLLKKFSSTLISGQMRDIMEGIPQTTIDVE